MGFFLNRNIILLKNSDQISFQQCLEYYDICKKYYKFFKGGAKVKNKPIGTEKNILFYNDEEGDIKIEVLLKSEDVWLSTESLSTLFNIDRSGIVRHINNIYNDNELDINSTCAKIAQVQNEGNRKVKRVYPYYNLDMIISIGFRVNSKKAIKFRTWANKIIKNYMVQGFALNDERFMKSNKSDQEYFQRLLERIKLIRTSERMFYQKIAMKQ